MLSEEEQEVQTGWNPVRGDRAVVGGEAAEVARDWAPPGLADNGKKRGFVLKTSASPPRIVSRGNGSESYVVSVPEAGDPHSTE